MNRLFSLVTAAAAVSLGGCTIVPIPAAMQACEVISIATREADLAPAWYVSAGAVLEVCGVTDAVKNAESQACYASARNGYTTRDQCEVSQ